jgi:hypothetical protein
MTNSNVKHAASRAQVSKRTFLASKCKVMCFMLDGAGANPPISSHKSVNEVSQKSMEVMLYRFPAKHACLCKVFHLKHHLWQGDFVNTIFCQFETSLLSGFFKY